MDDSKMFTDEFTNTVRALNLNVNPTPRQRRTIDALMSMQWVSRESIDRIAGASNGPHVIHQMRKKYCGHDGIEMRMVKGFDRDGLKCETGQYRLTKKGRAYLVVLGLIAEG